MSVPDTRASAYLAETREAERVWQAELLAIGDDPIAQRAATIKYLHACLEAAQRHGADVAYWLAQLRSEGEQPPNRAN